jgi:hypothetical protein
VPVISMLSLVRNTARPPAASEIVDREKVAFENTRRFDRLTSCVDLLLFCRLAGRELSFLWLFLVPKLSVSGMPELPAPVVVTPTTLV